VKRFPTGVGGLEKIVNELYKNFMEEGVTASIYVVCGRNTKLKENLASKDWGALLTSDNKPKKRRIVSRILRRKMKTTGQSLPDDVTTNEKGDVKVVGLGFVTNMAEYMVAADILVSKAGPGKLLSAVDVFAEESILIS
jgi:1,2-diacylglycerol 3-beta-galactosyltransferase